MVFFASLYREVMLSSVVRGNMRSLAPRISPMAEIWFETNVPGQCVDVQVVMALAFFPQEGYERPQDGNRREAGAQGRIERAQTGTITLFCRYVALSSRFFAPQ